MSEPSSRLARNGRAIDPDFLPAEKLYIRCNPKVGISIDSIFSFSEQSANRSKYSLPEDVLIDRPEFKVSSICFEKVPTQTFVHPANDQMAYKLNVQHVPEDENYSHSEIQCHANGQPLGRVKPPPKVRAEIRAVLVHHLSMLSDDMWVPLADYENAPND